MYTEEQIRKMRYDELEQLRERRRNECFYYVDRGNLWWEQYTTEQQLIITTWRNNWLIVTDTLTIPPKPDFI